MLPPQDVTEGFCNPSRKLQLPWPLGTLLPRKNQQTHCRDSKHWKHDTDPYFSEAAVKHSSRAVCWFLSSILQSPSWIFTWRASKREFTCFCLWGQGKNKICLEEYCRELSSVYSEVVFILPESYCSQGNLFRQIQALGKVSQAGSWSNKPEPGCSTKIRAWPKLGGKHRWLFKFPLTKD